MKSTTGQEAPTTRRLEVDERFDLSAILDGTQDFRWRSREGDWYSGVLDRQFVHVHQVGRLIEYRADSDQDELLRNYFCLDDDIDAIHAELVARAAEIEERVLRSPHLRVLRQPDPWECMVAYICSAKSNLAATTARVEKIAEEFHERVGLDDGKECYGFPTSETVRRGGPERLEGLTLGLNRGQKIFAAATRIHAWGLDLDHLADPAVCYAEAKRQLMACNGIAAKIADCICLFALGKHEAFPVDVRIGNALDSHFPETKQLTGEQLVIWAQDKFGKHAGYASQFLFLD